MTKPNTRQTRTPRERAEEALAIAERALGDFGQKPIAGGGES